MIRSDYSSDKKFLIGEVLINRLNKSVGKIAADRKDYQVSLKLVSATTMSKLNGRWRGQAGPTDVLAWPFTEGRQVSTGGSDIYLGEIVINWQQAVRQARVYHHSRRSELARLYVHGLLHLLGYDHNTDRQARQMKNWEDKILKSARVKL